jgi:hypothetical protein
MNRSSIGDGARAADQPCAPRLRPLFFGLSWLLSLSAVAGCGDGPPRDISGVAIDTYDSGAGKTTAPASSTKWTAIGAVADQDGELTLYPGEVAADGTIHIADVPEGPYLLALTSPPLPDFVGAPGFQAFYANTAPTVDLGAFYSHRQGLEAITRPTFLILSAPLTIPWQDYTQVSQGNVVQELSDTLFIASRSADVSSGIFAANQTGAPKNGASAIEGWPINAISYFKGYGKDDHAHLIEADKNDDLALIHNVRAKVTATFASTTPDPWASYTWASAREVLRPAPFTMTNGGSTTLTGSFEALPEKTFSVDYKGSLWNALLSEAPSPNLYAAALKVGVYGKHGAPRPARGGFVPLVYLSSIKAVRSDEGTLILPGDHAHDFLYGNPMNGGQELAQVSFTYWVDVSHLLNGDTSGEREYLTGSFLLQAPAAELSGAPIKPVVGLPRNVKVNGQPAPVDKLTMDVGTTPEISFDAPALGSPDEYMVRIVGLTNVQAADGYGVAHTFAIGAIHLSGSTTSVKIPEGLLKAGKPYYIQVFAIMADDADPAAPFRESARYAYARTFTGVVVP